MIKSFSILVCLLSISASVPALAQNSDRAEFPGRRVGGGTRGECLPAQPLVALNPASNLAVTASDKPTVYFSMPMLEEARQVEFFVRDLEGNFVYETAFAAGEKAEILGVTVPADVLTLEQDYQWYFSVVCDPLDRSQNVVLEGWLRRTSPFAALTSPTSSTTPTEDSSVSSTNLDLALSYEQAGLWGDAIATLVELRQTHPENSAVEQQWDQLLQKLELDGIIE